MGKGPDTLEGQAHDTARNNAGSSDRVHQWPRKVEAGMRSISSELLSRELSVQPRMTAGAVEALLPKPKRGASSRVHPSHCSDSVSDENQVLV